MLQYEGCVPFSQNAVYASGILVTKSRPQDDIRGNRPQYSHSLSIYLNSYSTCYYVTSGQFLLCFHSGSSSLALRSMAMASQHLCKIALLFDLLSFQPRTTVLTTLRPFSQHFAIVNQTQKLCFKIQPTILLK